MDCLAKCSDRYQDAYKVVYTAIQRTKQKVLLLMNVTLLCRSKHMKQHLTIACSLLLQSTNEIPSYSRTLLTLSLVQRPEIKTRKNVILNCSLVA